jgi:hypothetical protein
LLVAGTDYVTTTTNTISSLAALAASDIVEVVVYDIFSVADTVSASSGGTFNGSVNVNGDLILGDNDKAIFGAGSDLQIYHSGTQSIIEDVGTGPLRIRSNSISIENELGTETISALTQDGAVTIYYNGSPKLATTSTGVDVTGTVTATSFSGDGSGLTGAGIVLQAVTAVDSTTTAVTSGSDVTVHSVTITPSSTSSKVLILASYTGYIGGSSSTERFFISLKRGATLLADTEMYRDSGYMKAVPSQFNHLDSPSSTSAVTYNITIRRVSGGDSFGWCEGGKEAVLTALEIS